MDEKWHPALVAIPGEGCHIGYVSILGCRQARLGLNKSLSSRLEVLVLVQCDPYFVGPQWNIERKRSRSGIEINWGLNGEHKNVRQLTLKIVSFADVESGYPAVPAGWLLCSEGSIFQGCCLLLSLRLSSSLIWAATNWSWDAFSFCWLINML
jgi:hypothetical protein